MTKIIELKQFNVEWYKLPVLRRERAILHYMTNKKNQTHVKMLCYLYIQVPLSNT